MATNKIQADLTNKVVLVTGAGSGFGQAMSVSFCKAGARVFGIGRRTSKLEETSRLIAGMSGSFSAITWDVSKTHQARDIIEQVVGKAGALHVLVNNAAVLLDDKVTLSEISIDLWEKTLSTNVSALFALTGAAFVPMRKQRYGRVINVTSGLAFEPMLEFGSYCISKAAVNMMTRVFALDGEKSGILVNAIEPGVARTEMNTYADESPQTICPIALKLATLPEGSASGKCFNKQLAEVAW